MTDQEIRIAIAEACGWKWHESDTVPYLGYWEHGNKEQPEYTRSRWLQKCEKWDDGIPEYLNDLNAMHEAWDTLSQDLKIKFHLALKQIVQRDLTILTLEPIPDILLECYASNATAAQRAEAFLKTKGLWK